MNRFQQVGRGERSSAPLDAPLAATLLGIAVLALLFAGPNPLEASSGGTLKVVMAAAVAVCTLAGLALGCVPRVQEYVRRSEPHAEARLPYRAIPVAAALTGGLVGLAIALVLLAGSAAALWAGWLNS